MTASTSTANLFAAGSPNRVVWICVFASILAHSAILLLFSGMRQSQPAVTVAPAPAAAIAAVSVTVITATLANRVAAPQPALTEAPRPPEPERPTPQVKLPGEPPRPVVTRPVLTRPDSAPSASAPRVVESPPPVQTATAPPSISQAPVNLPRAPEVQAPPVSSGPPQTAPAQTAPVQMDSADGGNLDQYRVALLGAANRYKRYPAIAMEKGWTGKVEVRMIIGTNGVTQSIVVKSSSGFEILDKTALDMVTKAKPMTPIPPALRGREFTVDIPVIFSLQIG